MRHMVPTKQRFSAPTVVHTTSKSYPSSILLYIYRSNQAINQESSYYQNKIYVAYHPEIIIAADVKWADLSFLDLCATWLQCREFKSACVWQMSICNRPMQFDHFS